MGKIWCIYFSPSGTTKVVMERIAAKMDGEKHTWDLPVSYTHLDVYKRQLFGKCRDSCALYAPRH